MKVVRRMAAAVGGLCVLFGFIGFVLAFAGNSSNGQDVFHTAKAVNHIQGMAADTDGNLYIGDEEGGYLQVFNSDGVFLYGFSFATDGGWFAFGIDDQNILRIVTARTKSYLQYVDGSPVRAETVDDGQAEALENAYHLSSGTAFANDNFKYEAALFHKVRVYDPAGGLVKTITLQAPVFPFSFFCDWLIGILGMGLLIYSLGSKRIKSLCKNHRFFYKQGLAFFDEHDLRNGKHG